jgi:hypothetical protein
MGKSNSGSVVPPTTPVTVSLTLTLAEANDLLVALANAINNVGPKGKGKKGGSKGKSTGGTKGSPKGTPKGSPKAAPKATTKGPAPKPTKKA